MSPRTASTGRSGRPPWPAGKRRTRDARRATAAPARRRAPPVLAAPAALQQLQVIDPDQPDVDALRILAIGLVTQLSHELWDIDAEFVRRRVGASVVAGATVEAEIAQMDDVLLVEGEAELHRREHRAMPFAVADMVVPSFNTPTLIAFTRGLV